MPKGRKSIKFKIEMSSIVLDEIKVTKDLKLKYLTWTVTHTNSED